MSLWTASVCTLLSCGPAGTIDGELSAENSSQVPDDSGDPIEMEESKPICIMPNLASLRAELFVPECGMCHGAVDPQEDLDLTMDETALRARLMMAASESPSGIPLVMPGATGSSYLYLKIAVRTPLIGDRMPKDEDPLMDCTVEAVRKWIADGAQ